MTGKSSGIKTTNYISTLKDIFKIYEQSLNDGTEDWNKAVLSSNYKIGQCIIEITQSKKSRASYGEKILKQLSSDLTRKYTKGFSERNLNYIRKFYQTYKKGNFHSELSWSHYVCLLLIDDSQTRRKLEKFAIQKKIPSRDLLIRVKQELKKTKNNLKLKNQIEETKNTLTKPTLQLYTYRLVRKYNAETMTSAPYIDLGFSIRLEEKNTLPKFKIGSILESKKNNKTYSFQPKANLKELFTYKAYLERVIDGDTLLVTIDLGFSVFIEQRLRLRGIDTPELNTRKGIRSKKFVEASLKNCKFLILKTHGKDKYDRYLVDVFYLKNEVDEEKVIKNGLFLNNELLIEGLAVTV